MPIYKSAQETHKSMETIIDEEEVEMVTLNMIIHATREHILKAGKS